MQRRPWWRESLVRGKHRGGMFLLWAVLSPIQVEQTRPRGLRTALRAEAPGKIFWWSECREDQGASGQLRIAQIGRYIFMPEASSYFQGNSTMQSLTLRQRNVLEHLLAGKQNKEIAFELNLAEQTVKNDVRDLFAYFGIKRTRELLPIIDRVKQEVHRVEAR
jgi:DNA-binding CsgD family transcriptional regulator